ncbi:MAG: hypothetical protein WC521_01485 [Bdellovibrionales bacterium]
MGALFNLGQAEQGDNLYKFLTQYGYREELEKLGLSKEKALETVAGAFCAAADEVVKPLGLKGVAGFTVGIITAAALLAGGMSATGEQRLIFLGSGLAVSALVLGWYAHSVNEAFYPQNIISSQFYSDGKIAPNAEGIRKEASDNMHVKIKTYIEIVKKNRERYPDSKSYPTPLWKTWRLELWRLDS